MAELSFIEGTPDSINLDDLIKGAQEAQATLDDYEAAPEDLDTAREDLEALVEILEQAGIVSAPEDVADHLRSFQRESGDTWIERDSVEQYARDNYDDENLSNLIRSNINWEGVGEDLIAGLYEFPINNGIYYPL